MIRKMVKTQIIITDKVTNFTCQGKGNPPPTITWLKNGQKISSGSRVALSLSTSGDKLMTSELVITNTKYDDSGVYTCVIDNILGGTNSSVTLLVHGKLVNSASMQSKPCSFLLLFSFVLAC